MLLFIVLTFALFFTLNTIMQIIVGLKNKSMFYAVITSFITSVLWSWFYYLIN